MFGFFLTAIITLMHIYVFWRISSVPFVKRRVSLKILIGAGVVLWGIFYLSRALGHGSAGFFAGTLELVGMDWMASLFLVFVCLLAVDVVTGFGFLLRRRAPFLRGWAVAAGGALSVIALVQGMRPPVVKDYKISLSGLPDDMEGVVIVAMSDLHLGTLLGGRWLEARIAQVEALRPDLVVLLGDMFEGHGGSESELVPIFSRLSAPLGVWAVPGNHESHGRQNTGGFLIEEAGFQMLRNRWIEVRPGLVLAGVDDLTSGRRSAQVNDPLSKALELRPPGATILLSHTPWQADRAAKAGVGLMLSGHTHAGQIWPFSYLVKRRYPLFAGRYEVDGMTVIVCRGTGTWGPRMRLWRPSEILRVKISGKRSRESDSQNGSNLSLSNIS